MMLDAVSQPQPDFAHVTLDVLRTALEMLECVGVGYSPTVATVAVAVDRMDLPQLPQ